MANTILSSDWGGEKSGLSQHLIAKIYPVDDMGNPDTDKTTVAAPLTEGNLEVTLNWQSSFENTGTDSKLPAISQLLQSGQAEVLINLAASIIPTFGNDKLASFVSDEVKNAKQTAKELTGRTGITRLNSRQIFTGMPPLKLPVTLYFRAWSDPITEVENPVDQLFDWLLPQELSNISILEGFKEKPSLLSLFPSKIPRFVALEYGGRTYKPLVIEGVSKPLVLPRDGNGAMLSVSVQLTLATLTAWDRHNWRKTLNRVVLPVAGQGTITEAT